MVYFKFKVQRRIFINRFRKILLSLVPYLIFLISSCEKDPIKVDVGIDDKLNYSSEEYQEQFRQTLASKDSSGILLSSIRHHFDTLKFFYAERNFEPIFIKSFEVKDFIDSLLALLGKADEHGLNPERYHFSLIKDEFKQSINENVLSQDRYKHLANTELLVCDAIIKYAYHLRYGVLNPTEIFLNSYYLPIPDSTQRDLLLPLHKSDVLKFLIGIQPKNKKYLKLQAALKHFEQFKDVEWTKIHPLNKKLKLGDHDSILIQISERLITLGLLDTSTVKINDFEIYDSLFQTHIKKFQRTNGLIDDGVIGKTTVEKLNITPKQYIDKIKINLERFRWIDYSDTAKYILVNIPDFRLHVIENGKEKFEIIVCTGRKRYANFEKQYQYYKKTKNWRNKPEDWETPLLYAQISHLVLNPTWTVPTSIMREEIAAKVRNDSAYLSKANFKVYKNGKRIDPSEVKPNELNVGSIPFTIIQNPGNGNALGKIKFMFENPFGIYLHDTPTRAPFGYANRAVSHGCVRVEKPLSLAEYLLADNSKWTIDYLKIEVGSKVENKSIVEEFYQKRSELRKDASYGQTTEVKLDMKIPLFIDYYTAWVDDNGMVNFRDDVYNKDKKIREYLSINY
jgi:murein L,D-transpeptidase YcbB/YkuD